MCAILQINRKPSKKIYISVQRKKKKMQCQTCGGVKRSRKQNNKHKKGLKFEDECQEGCVKIGKAGNWEMWKAKTEMVNFMSYVENSYLEPEDQDPILALIYKNYIGVMHDEEFFKDLVAKVQLCTQICCRPFPQKENYDMFLDSGNCGSVLMKHNRSADGICTRNGMEMYEAMKYFHTTDANEWPEDMQLIEIKGAQKADTYLYHFQWNFHVKNPFRERTCFVAVLRRYDEQWSVRPDQNGNCEGINVEGQWTCPCYIAFLPVAILESLMELWFDVHTDPSTKSFFYNPILNPNVQNFTQILSRRFKFIEYGDKQFDPEIIYKHIFETKDEYQKQQDDGLAQKEVIQARVDQYRNDLKKKTEKEKAVKTIVHVINMIEFYRNPQQSIIRRSGPVTKMMKEAAKIMEELLSQDYVQSWKKAAEERIRKREEKIKKRETAKNKKQKEENWREERRNEKKQRIKSELLTSK